MNYIQDHIHKFYFEGDVVKEEDNGKVEKIYVLENNFGKKKFFVIVFRTISEKLESHLNSIRQYSTLQYRLVWQ